jgi:hypothetical protein
MELDKIKKRIVFGFPNINLIYLRVDNEDFICFFSDADEGVNDVSAHLHRDVFNAISANARPVHRPVAEVTYYTRFAVRWNKIKSFYTWVATHPGFAQVHY